MQSLGRSRTVVLLFLSWVCVRVAVLLNHAYKVCIVWLISTSNTSP